MTGRLFYYGTGSLLTVLTGSGAGGLTVSVVGAVEVSDVSSAVGAVEVSVTVASAPTLSGGVMAVESSSGAAGSVLPGSVDDSDEVGSGSVEVVPLTVPLPPPLDS